MKLRQVRVLRGPNLWALCPVLEAEFEFPDQPVASDRLAGLAQTLEGLVGRTLQRKGADRELVLAHLWADATAVLQSRAWQPVKFTNAERFGDGSLRAVVEFRDETLGRAAAEAAADLLAKNRVGVDEVEGVVERLRQVAAGSCLPPPEASIAAAAVSRGIPHRRLSPPGVIQLGEGALQVLVSRNASPTVHSAKTSQGLEPVDPEIVDGAIYAVAIPGAVGSDGAVPAGCVLHRIVVVGPAVVAAVRIVPGEAHDSATDVTTSLHPEIAARCVETARALGLDVALIELHCEDAARPIPGQAGGVGRVFPGLGDDTAWMSADVLRRFGEAVVELHFPTGRTGRLPTGTITGVNGKTTTTRLLAAFMKAHGHLVGMTCSDGIVVGGRIIDHDDCSGPRSARRVLRNPTVTAAVLEVARGGILREGLGFLESDVAIVTNIADGDHLGIGWVKTPEDLARVKQVTVDAVGPHGAAVLHAEDPLTVAMAPRCRGRVVYFSRHPDHPTVVKHRASGGVCLLEMNGVVTIVEAGRETAVMRSDEIPLTRGGRLAFQVENVLAAVAAGHALGVPVETMRRTLRSFDSDMRTCPGRFNVLEHAGATIILDFGHNPSAVTALVQAVDQFPATKRHVVYSADGDRSDAQIRQQTANLGGAFDHVVLYEEPGRFRGRQPGDLYRLLREGLEGCTRVKRIEQVDGEVAAIRHALGTVKPGELLLIQVDSVSVDLEFVCQHLGRGASAG